MSINSSEYDALTAKHYQAYRPNLHEKILAQGKRNNKKWSHGLDVGCGTGRSAYALAKYSQSVIGLEPNVDMFSQIKPHDNIQFINSDLTDEHLPLHYFDVITLAGSLNYIDATFAARRLSALATSDGQILIYDFNIDFSSVMDQLKLVVPASNYQYEKELPMIDSLNLKKVHHLRWEEDLLCTVSQVVHLLLSHHQRAALIMDKFESENNLFATLDSVYEEGKLALRTTMYSQEYSLTE